jgi:hypothetical protein
MFEKLASHTQIITKHYIVRPKSNFQKLQTCQELKDHIFDLLETTSYGLKATSSKACISRISITYPQIAKHLTLGCNFQELQNISRV